MVEMLQVDYLEGSQRIAADRVAATCSQINPFRENEVASVFLIFGKTERCCTLSQG